MHRFREMVDLALKFLNVAMCDILIARILLVALVELRVEADLGFLDFLINLLYDSVDILSLAHLNKNASFEIEHGLLNNFVVEVDHVRRYLTLEVRILVHDWFESVLAEAVCINVVEGSVEEFRLIAKEVLVPTDDGLVTKLDVEVFLVGVAESNAVFAILLFRFR